MARQGSRSWTATPSAAHRRADARTVGTEAGIRSRQIGTEGNSAYAHSVGRSAAHEALRRLRRDKLDIRSLDMTWRDKKIMLSVAVAELVVAKQKLNQEVAEERAAVPGLTYQQWVEQKAEAGVQDSAGLRLLLPLLAAHHPAVRTVYADGGYQGTLLDWAMDTLGIRLSIIKRTLPKGFQVLPKRWFVERTLAWLGWNRRLSKDYELNPHSAECFLFLAAAMVLLKRIPSS